MISKVRESSLGRLIREISEKNAQHISRFLLLSKKEGGTNNGANVATALG